MPIDKIQKMWYNIITVKDKHKHKHNVNQIDGTNLKRTVIIMTLRTIRGQAARVIKNENNKFIIELYANGKWVKPCHNQEFNSELEATAYFETIKDFIHC